MMFSAQLLGISGFFQMRPKPAFILIPEGIKTTAIMVLFDPNG
jgi:hypothetical protein